ncbi:hypothetical protein [Pseudomonas sp. BN411]|uniref:hypothetical protein n=1 Tax=Pseudomonas sp. BN411 TaxID=2567887 RepID=UPI00245691BD|nr:hypothetical protein [Pseudomonas sp. BN411]MDH4562432.1 hypothetical protein [Pseudomonas sp. BN411]
MSETTEEIPCREARRAIRELYESAHLLFLERLEVFIDKIEYPLSYDLSDKIQKIYWGPAFMELAIANDLRETINQLHSWYGYLVDWSLWIDVLKQFEGEQEWSIRRQYVEHLAFYCMLQPSSTRERFGSIATNALHQANLALQEDYKDRLDQDEHGYLSRRKREMQLKRIGANYTSFAPFLQALTHLDNKAFSTASYNFRDLASHGIAPRFEQGETSFVRRSIKPWSELVKQPDGTAQFVEHPTKKAVCYGFGGTQPLSFQQAYDACWQELLKAIQLFHTYQALLRELSSTLARRYPGTDNEGTR